jgi:hypothetical protein
LREVVRTYCHDLKKRTTWAICRDERCIYHVICPFFPRGCGEHHQTSTNGGGGEVIRMACIALLLVGTASAVPLNVVHNATDRDEFEAWLAEDSTDRHQYVKERYECLGFSDDLIHNASKAGYVLYLMSTDGRYANGEEVGHFYVSISFDGGIGSYDPQTDVRFLPIMIARGFTGTEILYRSGYTVTSPSYVMDHYPYDVYEWKMVS